MYKSRLLDKEIFNITALAFTDQTEKGKIREYLS